MSSREYYYNQYLISSDPNHEFSQVLEPEELLGVDSVLDSVKLRLRAHAKSIERSKPELSKAIYEAAEKVIG